MNDYSHRSLSQFLTADEQNRHSLSSTTNTMPKSVTQENNLAQTQPTKDVSDEPFYEQLDIRSTVYSLFNHMYLNAL